MAPGPLPVLICALATMVTVLADGRGSVRSTVALPEAPKFVAGSGVQPWERGRLSKDVMLAAVGVVASRSLFGSEKIEVPFALPSPSPPLLLGKLLVPITTEFGVTPRVGKSPKLYWLVTGLARLLLKYTDLKPSSGFAVLETATRIWFDGLGWLTVGFTPRLISVANQCPELGS